MYCPQFLTEYREGFVECADCRVPLLPGLPPEPAEAPPGAPPVTVLETSDPYVLSMAKASLEDAGIESIESSPETALRSIGLEPVHIGLFHLQVSPDSEGEARNLVEPLLNPVPESELPPE